MDIWDNNKYNNIHIIRISEKEDREQGTKNLFEEIMTENFPNLLKEKRHTSPGSTESSKKMDQRGPHQDTS